MSLDLTAKKSNFYLSLKKYVIDNIQRNEGILVVFDKFLPPDNSVNRWIFVMQRPLTRDTVSEYLLDIYCVTRQDYEGDRLTELIDLVAGYFVGDTSQTDGLKRIPFYDSTNMTQNGNMLVIECNESDEYNAPDQSKFVILTILVKMASKI